MSAHGYASQRLPGAADVAAALSRRIDQLARELLPAGKRFGSYWKIGSIANEPGGSLAIHLTGPRAGKWTDFATGEFGDGLDLVAACLFRGNKSHAWHWACSWLGYDGNIPVAQERKPTPEARADAVSDDADRRRRAAARIWAFEARPSIAGTPNAAYLGARGIDLAVLGRQPRALRFHPSLTYGPWRDNLAFPAMVAAISGPDGTHIATHRTWIERDVEGVWRKANVENPRLSLGSYGGGSIRIWRGASGKPLREALPDEWIVIGEGIETCLSIALACPELRVLSGVSVDNLGGVALPPQARRVILAVDNDQHMGPRLQAQGSAERHIAAGREVRLARAQVGNDFNDTLQAGPTPADALRSIRQSILGADRAFCVDGLADLRRDFARRRVA